jgi:hypothetical protein
MTKLLKKAFDQASKLPQKEQDAFAELILEELTSERRWAKAFSNSQKQLADMADAALEEFQQGKTRPLSDL